MECRLAGGRAAFQILRLISPYLHNGGSQRRVSKEAGEKFTYLLFVICLDPLEGDLSLRRSDFL